MKIYENRNNWIIEDQLDNKLVEKITNIINENLNNLLKLKEGYSTKGKNAEQYWLIKRERCRTILVNNTNQTSNFYFKNKDFEDVKKEYKYNILNRLKKSNLLNEKIKNLNIIESCGWSVVGEENSFHPAHSHSYEVLDGISAILYLNVPKSNVENSCENDIFLIMDSGSNSRLYNSNKNIIEINPEVGKLLIFPSWIIHGTYPQSKGIRQTFNMDYQFTFGEKTKKTFKYN